MDSLAAAADGGIPENAPTICLVMIVRDEAPVLPRCLASVRDYIDAWVVCDTGSIDETPAVVEAALSGIPGELHHRPWRGFAENRTEAVALARPWADYLLMVDADMTLNVLRPFRHLLRDDAYFIRYEGRLQYYQPMLLSARHDWQFKGVTHEYVFAETAAPPVHLSAISLTHYGDGRSRAHKFERDIGLLEAALKENPRDARASFYLALSQRAVGNLDRALACFEQRVSLGGWEEEIWYSLYQMARILEERRVSSAEIVAAYQRAWEYRPGRLEPLPPLIRHLRQRGEQEAAYELAAGKVGQPPPPDLLFIERDVYELHLPLEYAHSCVATGRYSQALHTLSKILDEPAITADVLHDAIRLQARCLQALWPPSRTVMSVLDSRITVLMPFYNAGPYLERAVSSLLAQDDHNFRVLACDDASTDGCAAVIPTNDERFILRTNPYNLGGGRNFHDLLTEHCTAGDIIVHLDGDDWLCAGDALSYIRWFYGAHDCWVMYGQFQTSRGAYGTSRPFPDMDAFQSRRGRFISSHIRTYRAGLYHRIADQDPDYTCMKDNDGHWLRYAMDMAIMYPVMELAGFERVRFNDRILYTYNVENPLNLFRLYPGRERAAARCIQKKPSFQQIDSFHQ